MNKLELIDKLALIENLEKKEAKNFVESFFNLITKTMISNDKIEIRGFCSFFVKNYKEYIGRNPKTGAKINIKPKKLPFFKCGLDLKKRINLL